MRHCGRHQKLVLPPEHQVQHAWTRRRATRALGVRFTVPALPVPLDAIWRRRQPFKWWRRGSEEEEAEINEVFLREEVMIKTSRVKTHANIKGHRMSKYRKGLYNKLCQHCLLKDGNQVETCILRWGSERITRVERGEVVALHGQQERQNCFQSPRWQRQDLSLITKS